MAEPVLIVEDDPDFASSLELALGLAKIPAILASSAEEAQRIMGAESGRVRLGFFDIKLPGDDGISCLQQLREKHPELIGIIMTGFRSEELLARARAAGAVEILLKPFRLSHFLELAKKYSV